MRRDELYLRDIVEAADAIASFLGGIDQPTFADNDLLRSAVLPKLLIIGEAASRISKRIQERYPLVPWSDIVGFRNIAVHTYFSVDWGIVWTAATVDAPKLKQDVEQIIAQEFPAP